LRRFGGCGWRGLLVLLVAPVVAARFALFGFPSFMFVAHVLHLLALLGGEQGIALFHAGFVDLLELFLLLLLGQRGVLADGFHLLALVLTERLELFLLIVGEA